MIGTRLSHYRIVAELGAGAMGVVYKAEDEQLPRSVALKIIRPELLGDPQLRARFLREAAAAATVSHPFIATVYEAGEASDTTFIAMEYVEGRTLRSLLAAGPLPMRDVMRMAIEIAEGLARAHEAHVIHRDLKPDNVIVRPDGHVKILDFGLAKLVEERDERAGSTLGRKDTLPLDLTVPGQILGTPAYMSPEQARGLRVDPRSDVFAFGSVLYEMTTGTAPFRGPTYVDTLTSILHSQPQLPTQLRAEVPAELDWILAKCLAKDPGERYQGTRDLVVDLKRLQSDLESRASSDRAFHLEPVLKSAQQSTAPASPSRRRQWLQLAIACAAVAVLGLGALRALRPIAPPPLPEFQQLTFRRGTIFSARFAPDGRTILYGAAWDGKPCAIFTVRSEAPETSPLGFSDASILSVSRDGQLALSIGHKVTGWMMTKGTLARVAMAGRDPRSLLDGVSQADWSPDGKSLAVVRADPRRGWRLEYPIGTVLYSDTLSGFFSDVRVCPHGDRVAFIQHLLGGGDGGSICVVDLKGNRRILASGWQSAIGLAWSPQADQVWFTATRSGLGRALFAVTLDGKLRSVWNGPGNFTLHDIAADGRVLMTSDAIHNVMMVRAPGSDSERNLALFDASAVGSISADGTLLAFHEGGVAAGTAPTVHVAATDGSRVVRVGNGLLPNMSPDGKWIVQRTDSLPHELRFIPTGAGETRTMRHESIIRMDPQWAPDGGLVLNGRDAGGRLRAYRLDVATGQSNVLLEDAVLRLRRGGATAIITGLDRKAYLAPLGNLMDRRPMKHVTPSGYASVGWQKDGKSLWIFEKPGRRVEILDVDSGKRTLWKELSPPDPAGHYGNVIWGFEMTPDASAYAYYYSRLLSDLLLVSGLR